MTTLTNDLSAALANAIVYVDQVTVEITRTRGCVTLTYKGNVITARAGAAAEPSPITFRVDEPTDYRILEDELLVLLRRMGVRFNGLTRSTKK